MDDTSATAIATALNQVGERLRGVRVRRALTLVDVSETTGISRSTLSRLETGQRRPTLELLLALSHAYRVPLDDLVAAPEQGDPRLRLRPGRVKGRTVFPLTRQPGGLQAWKIVVPTDGAAPKLRSHEGSEWLLVLSGRLRLLLGTEEQVLSPGEVVSFDTNQPHWFGSTGDEPAEVLSIFARPGERMIERSPGRRGGPPDDTTRVV